MVNINSIFFYHQIIGEKNIYGTVLSLDQLHKIILNNIQNIQSKEGKICIKFTHISEGEIMNDEELTNSIFLKETLENIINIEGFTSFNLLLKRKLK